MTDGVERLFGLRVGPNARPEEWTLRVRPLEPWTEAARGGWIALVQDAFLHLAVVGGLAGGSGPITGAVPGDVDVWELDDWVEWRFGALAVDPASVTLLVNLCEWATLNVAPAAAVEVLVPDASLRAALPDRPLPGRHAWLSFPVDEAGTGGSGLSIQVEFARPLTGAHVGRISHLLRPWQTTLFRGGFALATLPPGESVVRPADPPIVVVDDLFCWNYDEFAARYEAVDAFLNCLELIHRTVCPVTAVAVE